MPFRLIPRETSLNDLIEGLSARLPRSAARLRARADPRGRGRAPDVDEAEPADALVARLVEALDRAFITPFDREDLYRLAASLADVEESVRGAARRLDAMGADAPGLVAAVGAIDACCTRLDAAVGALREMKKRDEELRGLLGEIDRRTVEARQALHEGDDAVESDLGAMLRRRDLRADLGRALDACRAAGRVATVIVVKGD